MATETYYVVRRRISGTERWEYLRARKMLGANFSVWFSNALVFEDTPEARESANKSARYYEGSEVIPVTVTFPD